MTAATAAPPSADWTAGLAVLQAWANTGRPFSSTQTRDELQALGFTRFDTGRLFLDAEAQGIIRQIGLERSKRHRSRIARWISAEARTPLEALTGARP